MTGAAFNRGASKQNYATPRVFIDAVVRRFGRIDFDLAAEPANKVSPRYFGVGGVAADSLARDWTKLKGHLWLNPPFDSIAPWARKCAETLTAWRGELVTGRRISFLVPASVGSVWFADHVFDRGCVCFLRPRLSFDGKNPYPKDCMLVVYGERQRCECWRWA